MKPKPICVRRIIMISTGLFLYSLIRAQSFNHVYYVENSGSYSVQQIDTIPHADLPDEEGEVHQRTENQFERYLQYRRFIDDQTEQITDGESVLRMVGAETSEELTIQELNIQSEPIQYYANLIKTSANFIARKFDADSQKVEEYWTAACDLQYDIGIPAPVLMAIALKASSFNSPLFLQTQNPFGIKASCLWLGPTFSMWHDGEPTLFRVYKCPEEALLDFGDLIHSRWWYDDALSCPFDDFRCFVEGLKKKTTEPGYALDPDWGDNILRLIAENNLEIFCRR